MPTANFFLRRRKELCLSLEGIATRVGYTRQAISKWELEANPPKLEDAVKLAKAYEVPVGRIENEIVRLTRKIVQTARS